tara:strand:- start:151 stop:498 length:348 start_codon:yes stop_codon:yes gene_type:complete
MEAKQNELFQRTGTFFAFSQKQFEEGRKDNVKYVDMGQGMITEKPFVEEVINELDKIHKEAMIQDIKENGIQGVIQRELENYETYYTNDLEPAMEALESYPEITQKDIINVYQRK